ncbi:MAG: hypothetical protein H0X30_35025 [Anaerolineae bacterium]|nr:hypothetical protein [Anaerolineae bacterium]
MTTPQLEAKLPELFSFIQQLAIDHQNGRLSSWDSFSQRVRTFYTPAMMTKIDAVISGWIKMASYAEQQTLIHVTGVLVALFLLPEYQTASADHKVIMEWMVMFHDVAKRAERNKHDYIHAFRSGAATGAALAAIGFSAQADFNARIFSWKSLTENAIIFNAAHNETIQDNAKLPDIISGIDALYGRTSAATLIIKGVLFHLSINNDPGYPTLAPLSQPEIQYYIDRDLFPILKAMMLVDSDGWNLFDPTEGKRLRQQTLQVFDNIARPSSMV